MKNPFTARDRRKRSVTFSSLPRPHIRTGPELREPLMSNLLADVRQLQKDVLSVSGFERERIGHELHDDFTQNLAGIACLSKQLQRRLEGTDSALAGLAEDITRELHDALERIRAASHELAPHHLEETDLAPALRTLVEQTEKRTRVLFRTAIDDSIQIEEVGTRLHLYRLSQEAIRNAIHHGRATEITVELQRDSDSRVRLTISDNGLGFPRDVPTSDGLGIRLMEYRCQQVGSALSLRNADNGGAVVECLFPQSIPEFQNVS